MEAVGLILWLWFVQTMIAAVFSAPLFFLARNRVIWPWEALVFVLPYATWVLCMFADGSGKSLANLAECFIIGAIIPVTVLARIVTPAHRHQWVYSVVLITAMCGVAVVVYVVTPPWPE